MLFRQCLAIISILVLLCFRTINSAGNSVTLSNQPYHIIWQTPSQFCLKRFNVSFIEALTKAGLTFNDNDRWYGAQSNIFYTNFGSWPYYKNGALPPINGGLPQLGNLAQHLTNVRATITERIPDTTFNGVAVIDMEEWRPLWERNWGWKTVYRTESLALVREIYKEKKPNESWVEAEANREFNEASRKFMTETLRTSRQLRPGGLWGYYHLPECFNNKPITLHCRPIVQDGNNEMRWVWEESSAVFPSIYIFQDGWSPNDAGTYMYAHIEESIRVTKLVKGKPAFVYTKMKYDIRLPESFYSKTVMLMSLRMGADFGIEGTVIWGSDGDYKTSAGCNRQLLYLNTIISPFTQKLIEFTKLCSQKRCSGLGRCVHRGALNDRFADEIIRDTEKKLNDWVIDDRYMCRCKDGTVAKDCHSDVAKIGYSSTLLACLNFIFQRAKKLFSFLFRTDSIPSFCL